MAELDVGQDEQGAERRVEKILRRARHEVGLRDLLIYGARLWTAVLAIGAGLYAAFAIWIETGKGRD